VAQSASSLPQLDLSLSLGELALFLGKTTEQTRKMAKKTLGKEPGAALLPSEVRQVLQGAGYEYPQKVISVQMLKGGVAKTTSVLNLGLRAAMYGAKVLFIDLDQQANLSFSLGIDDEEMPVWIDIVEKKKTIDECVQFVGHHVDLIPSSLNNSVLDRVLMNSNRNWAQAVKVPLEKIRHRYDLILMDTAPALSATNTAVAIASDEILLPVNPDRFSLLGLEKNLQELSDIKEDFSLDFTKRILFTKFDGREKTSHEMLQKCRDSYEEELMDSYIRTSTEVKNTIRSGKTLFSGKSVAKEDYDMAAREMLGFVE
jgi:chromosome partitioning protein